MIRILSDLHWGHKASRIRNVDALRDLVSDVDTVIFNGDTLEQKFEDSPAHLEHPLPPVGQFRDKLAEWGTKSVFITGNHDPAVSEAHYCEIDHGKILVTHGDAIFDSIAPWSANAPILLDLVRRGLQQIEASGSTNFYDYLQVFKQASIEEHRLLKDYDPTVWGKFQIFLRQAWPPTRPLRILECWRDAPKRAVELVRRFGLSPQFLIIGHTHKPDISIVSGTVVINTGAFLPWPGASAVDIGPDGITVRRIEYRNGKFRAGTALRRFDSTIETTSLTIALESQQETVDSAISSQFSA